MSKRALCVVVVTWAMVLAAGCPSPESDSGNLPTDSGPSVSDSGTAAVEYPPGPYGYTVGNIIQNHGWFDSEGFFLELKDLYQDDEVHLILINSSARWCSACQSEAPELETLYQEWADCGLRILAVIFEDQGGDPAYQEDAIWWCSTFGLTFDCLFDPEFQLGLYYEEGATPMNMLVDPVNMEIVWMSVGWIPGPVANQIYHRLNEFCPK